MKKLQLKPSKKTFPIKGMHNKRRGYKVDFFISYKTFFLLR
jgi:hypothetical protein